MKKVLCLGLVIGFICFSAIVSFAAEMKCEDAATHKGEKATVCGKIVDTFPNNGQTILGMGKGVQESGAVGIEIPDELKEKLPKDLYVGKKICVTGEIHDNPVGGASLTVSDPSQIKVK